jgi:LacI family transcriptional regulator
MKKTYTIKDIAKLAEVSEGTVDRVLHKRGKVSQHFLSKVMAVLDEIEYEPNHIARSLKNTKTYQICVLMPNPQFDPYWMPCKDGIDEAIKKHKSFNIHVKVFLFDPTSIQDFIETNEKLLDSNPDAVLIAPFFYKESINIISNYHSKNIISCTFNNQLKTNEIINFVGQDLAQSGRVAARLMDILLKDGFVAIIHLDEDYDNAKHMQEKEAGFLDYFESSSNKKIKVKSFKFKSSNIENELNNLLNENIDLSGIFITTSKAYQVAKILSQKETNIRIIGYDLLEKNIEYLQNKTIDFLINQNPKQQAYSGLTFLIDYLIFGKDMPNLTLLPIDIINSENYHLQ